MLLQVIYVLIGLLGSVGVVWVVLGGFVVFVFWGVGVRRCFANWFMLFCCFWGVVVDAFVLGWDFNFGWVFMKCVCALFAF